MNLSGHTVLITGGGTGIGLALAKAFLDLRNTVIVCGRSAERLAAVGNKHPRIRTIQCDIRNKNDIEQVLEKTKRDFGGVSILINNAGIMYDYNFFRDDDTPGKIENEIGTNLLGPLRLTKMFLPLLMEQPEAAIVNVTSGLAIVPEESSIVYCATKAAMHSFTKSLRYQLEHTPVKVFEILPPLVDTEMARTRTKDKISPEALAKEAIAGLKKDNYEIRIGLVKALVWINRLFPSLAHKLLRGESP